MGPEFSSDISGDGPDKDSNDKPPVMRGSSSSDSKEEKSDYRPSTPTKPRGMSKQKYKNLVRLHRKKYPRIVPAKGRSSRYDEYRKRTLKRQREEPELREKSLRLRALKRQQLGPEARWKEIEKTKSTRSRGS